MKSTQELPDDEIDVSTYMQLCDWPDTTARFGMDPLPKLILLYQFIIYIDRIILSYGNGCCITTDNVSGNNITMVLTNLKYFF
jgi:hypothetical protein